MTPLEHIISLAHSLGLTSVKEYSRLEKGKLEHVGQYEKGGTHPDDAMALREHLELATKAYERGDARGALEHLEDAKAHMAAPPGHGNSVTHGVQHKGGKHTVANEMASAMGKAMRQEGKKFGKASENRKSKNRGMGH